MYSTGSSNTGSLSFTIPDSETWTEAYVKSGDTLFLRVMKPGGNCLTALDGVSSELLFIICDLFSFLF